jgi:glycosyltransferase involved in cell wall biosynthesis
MRSIAFRKLPADYRSEILEDCSALIRSGPDKADHVLPLVSDRAARRIQRILYVQYTNPAAYPPLEHSSRILADAGWEVLFLGTGAYGANLLRFAPHPNVTVRQLAYCPSGVRQKVHYVWFCLWVVSRTLLWRPRWIYASDPLACPVALLLSYLGGLRVIYHEHDSPSSDPTSRFARLVFRARKRLSRRAAACVLPNEARARRFQLEASSRKNVFSVWNCPATDEVSPPKEALEPSQDVWLAYHGSIGPELLPRSLFEALARLPSNMKLRVVGYETVGSAGYLDVLRLYATELGVAERVEFNAAIPRFELMSQVKRCDIGIALMPMSASNVNMRFMAGASNKAFDYLACGLALVVSDLPDWKRLYVDPGYAVACDPDDARSIEQAVRSLVAEPGNLRRMGENGRLRILGDWNYRRTFGPLLQLLQDNESPLSETIPSTRPQVCQAGPAQPSDNPLESGAKLASR